MRHSPIPCHGMPSSCTSPPCLLCTPQSIALYCADYRPVLPPPPPPTTIVLQMAHYANDCWDGEVETTYGWVECVGLADRSAYDLTAHTQMSKQELNAYEKFAEPKVVDMVKVRGVARSRQVKQWHRLGHLLDGVHA